MRYAIVSLAAMLGAEAALACQPMTEGSLRFASHSVVWGTYAVGETSSEGRINIRRTEKGPRMRSIKVYWNSDSEENDGVSCPSIPRLITGDRARFFLHRDSEGSYTVMSYDHLREVREK